MAQKTDAQLKEYFQTSDTPTAAQFGDFIDSKRNKADKITANDLDPELMTTINNAGSNANVLTLPANSASFTCIAGVTYEKFSFINNAFSPEQILSIGLTAGVADVADNIFVTGNRACLIQDVYFETDTTIYFNNLPASTTIKIRIGI